MSSLTVRQLEILRLLASGMRMPEIADTLGISRWTVKGILDKYIRPNLEAATNVEAVYIAAKQGLI